MPTKITGKTAADGLVPQSASSGNQTREFVIEDLLRQILKELVLIKKGIEEITGDKLE